MISAPPKKPRSRQRLIKQLRVIPNYLFLLLAGYVGTSLARIGILILQRKEIFLSVTDWVQAFYLVQIANLIIAQPFILLLLVVVCIGIALVIVSVRREEVAIAEQLEKEEEMRKQDEAHDRLIREKVLNQFDIFQRQIQAALQSADPKQAQQMLLTMQGSLGNENLLAYLVWKYGESTVYHRGTERYPITVFPVAPQQQSDLESILLQPLNANFIPSQFTIASADFRNLVAQAKRPAWNGETFVMRHLFVDSDTGHVTLESALGKYYDMIDTCDVLEWEILSQHKQLTHSTEEAFQQFDHILPLRQQLHQYVDDPIHQGDGRSVAISLSCTIVYPEEGAYKIMIRKRSRQVAVHPLLYHVVPSFMFQPMTAEYEVEYSLRHNIMREYLEELFNNQEPSEGILDPYYFYSHPMYLELTSLLDSGQAELILTGISMNLLSFRPEIHTMLLIKSEKWAKLHIPFNFEWEPDSTYRVANWNDDERDDIPRISPITFLSDETDEQLMQRTHYRIAAKNLVPCAAGAFWLAIDKLRDLSHQGQLQVLMPTRPRR